MFQMSFDSIVELDGIECITLLGAGLLRFLKPGPGTSKGRYTIRCYGQAMRLACASILTELGKTVGWPSL